MSVLVELSMTPLGEGESVSEYVAEVVDIIDESGLPYRLGPMSTCLEGEWDEVFAVVRRCYERLRQHHRRILCSIRVDAREGQPDGRMTRKVERVRQRVARDLAG